MQLLCRVLFFDFGRKVLSLGGRVKPWGLSTVEEEERVIFEEESVAL